MKKFALCFFVLFMALPVLVSAQTAGANKAESERIITQGEFAVLYCQHIRLTPPIDGWTPESGVAAMSDQGINPTEGWDAEADLIERVMIELVHFAGIELETAYPERPVTVRKANKVFFTFSEIFTKYHPEYKNLGGENATYIEYEGNPGTQMSPSEY